MISVTIHKGRDGIIYGFRLAGHAGYSQNGTDIVCSAVSLLVINTLNCIERLTDEKADVSSDEEKGIIECVLPERKIGIVDRDADLLIKTMIFGLETLEVQYGKYIKVSEEAPKCSD